MCNLFLVEWFQLAKQIMIKNRSIGTSLNPVDVDWRNIWFGRLHGSESNPVGQFCEEMNSELIKCNVAVPDKYTLLIKRKREKSKVHLDFHLSCSPHPWGNCYHFNVGECPSLHCLCIYTQIYDAREKFVTLPLIAVSYKLYHTLLLLLQAAGFFFNIVFPEYLPFHGLQAAFLFNGCTIFHRDLL